MPSWWSIGAEDVAAWGLRTALAVGVLALVVWAVERVLRTQLAPRVRVALWSLVLVRSVMPFSIPLPISEELSGWTSALPALTASSVPDRVASAPPLRDEIAPEPSSIAVPHIRAAASPPAPVSAAPIDAPGPKAWWLLAVLAAWALGTVVHAARWISADRRFRRSALKDSEPAPGWLLERVARLAQPLGITRAPQVRTMDAGLGPAVLHGLARPTLFLSSDALTEADTLDALLAHELGHHRGRDRYSMLAVAAVRSVWWFHPAVQWTATRWVHALELTRDADAIRTLGPDSRVGYARRLLDAAAAPRPSRKLSALGLGWGDTTGGAEERIRLAAVPAGVTRRARWFGGVAVLGLGAAAVATAASSLQEASIKAVPAENSIAGDGDLDDRLAKLEFNAESEFAAVEVIAKRYGLNLILDPGFPAHRLNAKGTDISAREALDFIVRDYSGGVWREERGGVIRLSMPAAETGESRMREYDFSSVIEKALKTLKMDGWSSIGAEEAPEKLREALVETVAKVLNHAYPDEHHELTMEGERMRLTAGLHCHEALASLVDGLRLPTPLLTPELSMQLPDTDWAQREDGSTVASVLETIAATTGYLIATKGLDTRQLAQHVGLSNHAPETALGALGKIGSAAECSFHVRARSIVLSNSKSQVVRAYSVGLQPIFGGFNFYHPDSMGRVDSVQEGSATVDLRGSQISSGSVLLTGVAGSVVISTKGGGPEAMMLTMLAENAALKVQSDEWLKARRR